MRRYNKPNEASHDQTNHPTPNDNSYLAPSLHRQTYDGRVGPVDEITKNKRSTLAVIFHEGFLDSLRIQAILNALKSKPALRIQIIQNSLLQLLLIFSVLAFQSISDRIHSFWSTLDLFFNVFWLFPIMLISIKWNSSISEKILSNEYETEDHEDKGMKSDIKLNKLFNIKPKEIMKFLKFPSKKIKIDYYHKIIILLNYFLMSKSLLDYLPYLLFSFFKLIFFSNLIGILASFSFCSIANSFYCFEQSWSKRGFNFEQRLDLLEKRWDYHLGFGLIITSLTTIYPHHVTINVSIFTLFFPFLLILSNDKTLKSNNINTSSHSQNNHSIQLPIFFLSRFANSLLISKSHHPLPTNHPDFTRMEDGRNRLLD